MLLTIAGDGTGSVLWTRRKVTVSGVRLIGGRATAGAMPGFTDAGGAINHSGAQPLTLRNVVLNDNAAYVKEGATNSTAWVKEHPNVKQLVLSGDWIGIVRTDNVAQYKVGGLSAGGVFDVFVTDWPLQYFWNGLWQPPEGLLHCGPLLPT